MTDNDFVWDRDVGMLGAMTDSGRYEFFKVKLGKLAKCASFGAGCTKSLRIFQVLIQDIRRTCEIRKFWDDSLNLLARIASSIAKHMKKLADNASSGSGTGILLARHDL